MFLPSDWILEIGPFWIFEKSDFFDNHLLKSKILKRFKKKYVLTDDDFIVEHPTKVSLKKKKHNWDEINFSYDPRQGDISMSLYFQLIFCAGWILIGCCLGFVKF